MVLLEIKSVVRETDLLIESMCKGKRASVFVRDGWLDSLSLTKFGQGILARQKAVQLAAGLNDGEDILTYNGAKNRYTHPDLKCRGFCSGKGNKSRGVSLLGV